MATLQDPRLRGDDLMEGGDDLMGVGDDLIEGGDDLSESEDDHMPLSFPRKRAPGARWGAACAVMAVEKGLRGGIKGTVGPGRSLTGRIRRRALSLPDNWSCLPTIVVC
jgi:hypothetical protein